jgi:hypothetical protein
MSKPTYEELTAQNEALQKVLRRLVSVEHEYGGSLQLNGQFAYKVPESIFKSAKQALGTTPTACLAQVRAEAGQKGWMECARIYCTEEHFTPHPATGMTAIKGAHQYAESIRQEVK